MGAIAKEKPAKKQKEEPAQEPESAFEKAVILRPTSMSVGSITTNAQAVLEAVKEKAKQYLDVSKYEGDEKQAKDDRALLRKQKEATKTTIKSIEEAWNQPLEPFLDIAKKITKEFDFAIDAIDEWVKEGEAKEKEKKRKEIQAYFDTKKFDLVSLEKIFDDKWLNKTYKIWDVKKDIDAAIETIYSNIKILENIAEHGMTAKAFYLETLDMGAAMRQIETLKANAERLAREQIERGQRELNAKVAQNAAEERKESRESRNEEMAKGLAASALDIDEPDVPAAPAPPKVISYTCKFWGTEEQLKKLREYMTASGIAYEKIA